MLALVRLLPAGFPPVILFGREKEACDQAPEASADQSDFPRYRGLARSSWSGTSTSSPRALPGVQPLILRLFTFQKTLDYGIKILD